MLKSTGREDNLEEKLQPDEVHACHCTDLNSKMALSQVANLKVVGVGGFATKVRKSGDFRSR